MPPRTQHPKEKIILGIDPGTNMLGYGVLRVRGTKAEMMVMGVGARRRWADGHSRLERI